MALPQGALFQEPRGLALGQHNNHSGSCGLSAPLGQQGRTPRGLQGVCSLLNAPSRVWCPGRASREEGPHSRSPPPLTGYMVGAGTWPSDSWHSFPLPSTSPCSPKAETLLCPGLEARTREKTQNRSKTGSEAAMPGEPWGSAIERGGWPERGKSKKTQPQPPATWLPRLPAPPHSPTSL